MAAQSAAGFLNFTERVSLQEGPCASGRTAVVAGRTGASSPWCPRDGFAQLSLTNQSLRRSSSRTNISDRYSVAVRCGSGNGSFHGQANGVATDSIQEVPPSLEISQGKEGAQSDDKETVVVSNVSSTATKSTTEKSVKFTSVEDALHIVREGKIVILVNEEDERDVGNFFVAGSVVSEHSIAFMVNYGSGIIFSPASPAILDRLELQLMIEEDSVSGVTPLPFTITVDYKEGTSTGISAADRALTIRKLAEFDSRKDEFRRPGHVIPLRSSKGGILQKMGSTEAAVELAELAGLPSVGVLCGVTNSDGSMASLTDLQLLACQHSLSLVSISDLVRYRQEMLVKRTAVARLPTKWGNFQIYGYTSLADGVEHVAMVKGEMGNGEDVLCRVHSECLTGDIFGSQRCDCGPQLEQAMERIEREGRGVMIYMRGHEGRGIGLGSKLQAYNLQDQGRDTVEANEDLGLPVDSREYDVSAQILRDLGVRSLRLMTNNPAKYHALLGHGLVVKKRVPVFCPITIENKRYLETKRQKMGHLYGSDLAAPFGGLPEEKFYD